MSDKQLSPIAKAIAWCKEELKTREELEEATKVDRRRDMLTSSIAMLKLTIEYLQLLLEEEKKFAKDIWEVGEHAGNIEAWRDLTDNVSNYEYEKTILDFEDYYKKYEL